MVKKIVDAEETVVIPDTITAIKEGAQKTVFFKLKELANENKIDNRELM